MNIYDLTGRAMEIDAQYENYMMAIEMADGEVTPEMEASLNDLEAEKQAVMAEIAEKPEQYLRWYANEKANLDELKKTADVIAKKKKSREKKIDFIKELVETALLASGKTKVAGDTMKAWITNRKALSVDEEAAAAPYQKAIEELRSQLPSYITLDVKIMKSNVDKDAEVLPAGFDRVESTSLTIR